MGSRFKAGDKVRKIEGYPFTGTVCAVYENQEKCCVKHKDNWEHIFSDKQLDYDHPEYQYLDLLKDVYDNGYYSEGRNGATIGVFGRQIRFDLNAGFPILTTKKVHWKSVVGELLWFLKGDTNIQYLKDNGISIWDEWADENGNLGPVYGAQWRHWEGKLGHIDQIATVIENIKNDPFSRRHVVSAWNAHMIDQMALPPCHTLFQFYVDNDKLSCQLYQRSADMFLGVPFNIASYALLTHLIAREVGLGVGEFVHTFGDAHIYENHLTQVLEQLSRKPMPLPYLHISTDKSIFDLQIEDIKLMHYNSHPAIKAEVSK